MGGTAIIWKGASMRKSLLRYLAALLLAVLIIPIMEIVKFVQRKMGK